MAPVTSDAQRAQLVLACDVARRYYLADESKSDIATALGLSRFKVARLLASAREAGLVRIEVLEPEPPEGELADRLAKAYGLRECRVVSATAEGRRAAVGRAAAAMLSEYVGPDDILGLPWSRTVSALIDARPTLPPVPTVQLCGSQVIPGEGSPVDVVRAAARLTGIPGQVFYAPLLADDRESAAAFLRQPTVADAIRGADDVTVGVVSVGGWAPGQSTLYDLAPDGTRAEVAAAGVVGEVVGILFDESGRLVEIDLSQRVIGISGDQLRAIDSVIAVSHGTGKARATAAMLRGRLADSLVVDTELALALLELALLDQEGT